MKTREISPAVRVAAVAAALAMAADAYAVNVVSVYEGGGTAAAPSNGNFNTANSWLNSVVPGSSIDAELQFAQVGSYTATNDIAGTFDLNRLVITGAPAVNSFVAIQTNPLRFTTNSDGAGPQIAMNAAPAGATNNNFAIRNPVTLAANLTLTGGVSTVTTLEIAGGFGGAFGVTKFGVNNLVVSAAQAFTGELTLKQGSASVIGTTGALAGDVGVHSGASFTLGSNSGSSTSFDRLGAAATLAGRGGAINYNGGTQASTVVTETVGTLAFQSGQTTLSIGQGSGSSGSTLTTTLARTAGAAGVVIADAAVRKVIFTNDQSTLLKGGGAISGTSQSIYPWMLARASGSPASSFATHDATNGVRLLLDAEYATSLATAAATDNVSISNINIANDTTVNALRISGGAGNIATTNFAAGVARTLTVASGGVVFQNNSTNIGTTPTGPAGTLNFGAAEGVVHVIGSNTSGIGSTIANTAAAGLTKAGTGTLVLSGANTYDGTTTVTIGTLQVGAGAQDNSVTTTINAALGDGGVVVNDLATLYLKNGVLDAIDNAFALSLLNDGAGFGRATLETGVIETVAGLLLGGVAQAAGTYGSTASAALFKDDRYFSGAGVINVVPEPTTMTALALAAFALGRRRRV